MTAFLSSLPTEVISQVISEFHKSTTKKVNDEIANTPGYQQAVIELSKLHEIVRVHSPEVAYLMLKELDVPENITKLLLKPAVETNHSDYKYSWRLDQSVPNVQAILLNITNKSTGQVKTMRMDLSTFHKLRYNVSILFKEYAQLEKRVNK